MLARRSTASPRGWRLRRRLGRRGVTTFMRDISRRRRASSSGVHDPKSRRRSSSRSLAGAPIGATRSSPPSPPRSSPNGRGCGSPRSLPVASVPVSVRRSPSSTAGGRRGCSDAPRESATSTKPRNTSSKTASNVAQLGAIAGHCDPGEPVQLVGGARRGDVECRSQPPGPLGTHRDAGKMQTVGEAGDEVGDVGDQPVATQSYERAAASSASSRYLSTEPIVSSAASASRTSNPRTSQRGNPPDRLGDPGCLLHVERAKTGDGGGDLIGERRSCRRHVHPDDLAGAGGTWVVDPVIEAATLQRIVEVAGAVRGQHDDRWILGALRAELGDRDRRLGEQLEQERLELVVGAVDLVDEQDRRARSGMPQRAQQRPFDEELGREQVDIVERLRHGPPQGGCRAADGRSSTRTAPRSNRCPRSTGGARAACRAPRRAPSPPPSCPPRLRLRGAAAGGAGRRRTARSTIPGRRGTRCRQGAGRVRRRRGRTRREDRSRHRS